MEAAWLTKWSVEFYGVKFSHGLMASMFYRFRACVQKLAGENFSKKDIFWAFWLLYGKKCFLAGTS